MRDKNSYREHLYIHMSSNQVSYTQTHIYVTSESVISQKAPATNKVNLYTLGSLKALKAFKIYLLSVRLFCPFSSAAQISTLFYMEEPRSKLRYIIDSGPG